MDGGSGLAVAEPATQHLDKHGIYFAPRAREQQVAALTAEMLSCEIQFTASPLNVKHKVSAWT